MAGNSGGPWGGNGSGNNRPTGNNDDDRGNRRPSDQSGQSPEVEEMLRAGKSVSRSNGRRERWIRWVRWSRWRWSESIRGMLGLGALLAIGLWAFQVFIRSSPKRNLLNCS